MKFISWPNVGCLPFTKKSRNNSKFCKNSKGALSKEFNIPQYTTFSSKGKKMVALRY